MEEKFGWWSSGVDVPASVPVSPSNTRPNQEQEGTGKGAQQQGEFTVPPESAPLGKSLHAPPSVPAEAAAELFSVATEGTSATVQIGQPGQGVEGHASGQDVAEQQAEHVNKQQHQPTTPTVTGSGGEVQAVGRASEAGTTHQLEPNGEVGGLGAVHHSQAEEIASSVASKPPAGLCGAPVAGMSTADMSEGAPGAQANITEHPRASVSGQQQQEGQHRGQQQQDKPGTGDEDGSAGPEVEAGASDYLEEIPQPGKSTAWKVNSLESQQSGKSAATGANEGSIHQADPVRGLYVGSLERQQHQQEEPNQASTSGVHHQGQQQDQGVQPGSQASADSSNRPTSAAKADDQQQQQEQEGEGPRSQASAESNNRPTSAAKAHDQRQQEVDKPDSRASVDVKSTPALVAKHHHHHHQQQQQQQGVPSRTSTSGRHQESQQHGVQRQPSADPGPSQTETQELISPRIRSKISFFAGKTGSSPNSPGQSLQPTQTDATRVKSAAQTKSGKKVESKQERQPFSATEAFQTDSKQNKLEPKLSSEAPWTVEALDQEARHLVPLHLVDHTSFNLRSLSGRRGSVPSQASLRSDRLENGNERPSQPGLQYGSIPKGPSLRPSSDTTPLPFKPIKPPKQPSRPGSNKPAGPFGIKGFNQSRASSADSRGFYSGDSAGSYVRSLSGVVTVKGHAQLGETPADYMRGHAMGASTRWKGVEKDESRRWSRWGHDSMKSGKSRWEEDSMTNGLDARSHGTHVDNKPKVLKTAKLGGHTAGIGGHAQKLIEMGMQHAQADEGEFYQPPSLGGLVTVKTVNHGDRAVKVDQQKWRKPGQLITSTHARGRLPGATLNKDKEGQSRRLLAAAHNMYGPQPVKRKYIPRPPTPEGIILDGFLLLEAGNDELPEGVVVARLPSRHISAVEVADMSYFTVLKVLDLADNRIPDMTLLAPLHNLRALSLAMNCMGPVPIGGMFGGARADAFQLLSTLDLSYNALDANATLGPASPLAHMPALSELNLSGNKWLSLPPKLGPFTSLELLKLAENGLTNVCLAPLAELPALKFLGLAKNKVTGLQGALGDEQSFEEALAFADLDARTSFKSLHTLDLSTNKVKSEDAIKPLQLLPSLKSVILAGNPLAAKQMQAAKRAAEKRAHQKAKADKGAVPGPELLEQQKGSNPLWVYEPMGQMGPKPSVGRVLTGADSHFIAIQEPVGRQDAAKAATLAAVTTAVPEEAVTEVFYRADAAMEVWQLNTVPEEEEEEEESDHEPDGTFLTGVGITERAPKQPAEEPSQPEPQVLSEASSHSLWEDVSDPTERLALALGLDPANLAIHTGIPTTDATASVNALRYALAHPLVELGDGLTPVPKHMELTAAAKAKQRPRLQPLGHTGSTFVTAFGRTQAANPKRARTGTSSQVGSEASEQTTEGGQYAFPTDARTMRVKHVEGMLTGMRLRLDALEGTLTQQLSKLPPEVTARAQRSISRRSSRSPNIPCSPQLPSSDTSHSRLPALALAQEERRPKSPFSADMSNDEWDDDEADADEQLLEPESPGTRILDQEVTGSWSKSQSSSGKFMMLGGPAKSDVSSLPDDVVDAIENTDPSASSGVESDRDIRSRRTTMNDGDTPIMAQPFSSSWKNQQHLQQQQGNLRYSSTNAEGRHPPGHLAMSSPVKQRGTTPSSSQSVERAGSPLRSVR